MNPARLPPLLPTGPARVAPGRGLAGILGAGLGTFGLIHAYAQVKVPQIPPEKVRRIAEIFTGLADKLEGTGRRGGDGIVDRGRKSAKAVWENPKNGGETMRRFRTVYQDEVDTYATTLIKNCRVIAAGCEYYAALVEAARKAFADLENLLLQTLLMIAWQPVTNALFLGAARLAALIKVIQSTKVMFAAKMAIYTMLDTAIFSSASFGLKKFTQGINGVPLGSLSDNLKDFGAIAGSTVVYHGAYWAVRPAATLGGKVEPTRLGEAGTRIVGALPAGTAYGYLDEDDDTSVPKTDELIRIVGTHGLRGVLFPNGWTFERLRWLQPKR